MDNAFVDLTDVIEFTHDSVITASDKRENYDITAKLQPIGIRFTSDTIGALVYGRHHKKFPPVILTKLNTFCCLHRSNFAILLLNKRRASIFKE
eukprot:CFRG4768T1